MTTDNHAQDLAELEGLLSAASPADLSIEDSVLRLEAAPERWVLSVLTISWEGPHTPVSRWVAARTWPVAPNPSDLSAAVRALYASADYFGTCSSCLREGEGGRHLSGHMHDATTCQGCASRHLGVLY